MAFKRAAWNPNMESSVVTASMVSIGMNFAAQGNRNANIEDTLVLASMEGMEKHDLRVLSILVTWVGVHHHWVNADRLTKLVRTFAPRRTKIFWDAISRWLQTDRRFARLQTNKEPVIDLIEVGTEFHISRHGEDLRFLGSKLRVPANVLRDRAGDVLTPVELARHHSIYKSRLQIGPCYRADLFALLGEESSLSAAELARRAYAPFATAWTTKRDFGFLAGAKLPANEQTRF